VWREPVQPSWIDYNGHISEAYYVLVLGRATDAVMDHVGLGPEHREQHQASRFTIAGSLAYTRGSLRLRRNTEVRHPPGARRPFLGGLAKPKASAYKRTEPLYDPATDPSGDLADTLD